MSRASRILMVGVVCAAWLATALVAARAQPADLVAETQQALHEAERALPEIEEDYPGALRVRNTIEPLRDALRLRLQQLEPRRLELERQESQLGPKPAGDEPEAVAAERRRLAGLRASFEADWRPTLMVSQQSEQMWNRLTEIRRTLFSKRLIMHVASILDPLFWQDVVTFQIPKLVVRIEILRHAWTDYVRTNDNAATGIAFLACTASLVVLFFWLHRRIAARAGLVAVGAGTATETDALRHAAIVFAMRTLPLPVAALLFTFVARRLDVARPDVEDFLSAVAMALLVLGATRGAMGALLSPNAPRWRLVRAYDSTAATVSFMVVGAVDLYTAGIIATSFQRLVSQRSETEIATIMLLTAAMIALAVIGFRRLDRTSGARSGFVDLNLAWVRPIVSLFCVVTGLSLVFGYIALAGFLAGRLTISCLAVAVALLIVTTLDRLLDQRQASATPAGAALAHALGLTPRALDFAAVLLSGVGRLTVIGTAGLIVFAPWGLEYGDVNPFGDFAAFVTATTLRTWLGTFGFALLAFVVGIVGTRLVVGWMESTLLPRTSLEESVRHSIRTVLGYAGFIATALGTLYLIGINAQNVAVVAGALSIGIGFGLQSIVSNFVSGLILLAERPVRVGDVVAVKGEIGRVQHISVRSTLIGTFQQASVVIPNSDLISSVVRNRSLANLNLELHFTLMLDHDADVTRAEALILAVADRHENVLKTPRPLVLFLRITELGQELNVWCSADSFENKNQVRSDLHHQIARTFRNEGLRFARVQLPPPRRAPDGTSTAPVRPILVE